MGADVGLKCSYGFINAITYMIKNVTKILLGASGIDSKGMVCSRAGTAIVALVGHSQNKPIIASCESYKFSNQVHIDPSCLNELNEPDLLKNYNFQRKHYLSD